MINLAAKQDYDTFFNKELRYRHLLQNPPYTYLTMLILASEDENFLVEKMDEIKKYLLFHLDINQVEILGPSTMFINKYLNRYRRKFIRTLWTSLLIIPAMLLVHMSYHSVILTIVVGAVLLAIFTVQAVYNYMKWKKEKCD